MRVCAAAPARAALLLRCGLGRRACHGSRRAARVLVSTSVRWASTGGLTRSLTQGPDEPPLLPHTIPEHFASIVSKYGDRPAVICRSPTASADALPGLDPAALPAARETVYTYEALDRASNALAHSLRSLGVRKGDRVAVSLGNCPEFAALTYAVFKLGAILVPLNPAFNAPQVAAALSHLGVELLIIGAVTDLAYKPCRGRSNLPLLHELVPDLESGRIEAPAVPSLKRIVVVDNAGSHPLVAFDPVSHRSLAPFSTLLGGTEGVINPDAPLAASETINIQFTSGTTSHPKAAMLSHTSILNNGALIAGRMGLTPADLIVCPPPLFHCFGCVLGYMATATTGAALLLPSPAFDPLASLRMAADHEATGLYGVATMFVAMLELLAQTPPPLPAEQAARLPRHLRTGIAAGSSVPEALMRRLFDGLGLRDLVICYGMTETAPVSCMTSPADPLDKRTATVGRAMPHTRVKVVDPLDRARVLPVGERGELAASGYLVMQGYWGDEERTAEVRIAEPDPDTGEERVWMYSGDEAAMDADGYVAITGRIKDLIIRGGENIHPLEVENCLFQHPLVAEVSVVGVPDDRYGECVGAFVIPHRGVRVLDEQDCGGPDSTTTASSSPSTSTGTLEETGGEASAADAQAEVLTADAVREWVRTRLSAHLAPRYVFWVDEYPKTSSGKIQKYKLRDMAREMVAGGRRHHPHRPNHNHQQQRRH